MKKIFVVFMALLVAGCGLSDDCITSSGEMQTRQFPMSFDSDNPENLPFTKVFVNPGISLIVTEGPEYLVTVEAGANFIDEITVEKVGDSLLLKDNSGCNWVRDYGQTTIYLTAPNIEELYSNTEQTIRSNGVLTYPTLRLYSMDFFGGVGTGDFIMEVDNQQLVVQSNHVSAFFITGRTDQMLLNFYNGTGKFDGAGFIADDIKIFHRGSNDMIIHPVTSLSGDIYSTGNVISKTHPVNPETVEEHYTGRLLFD